MRSGSGDLKGSEGLSANVAMLGGDKEKSKQSD